MNGVVRRNRAINACAVVVLAACSVVGACAQSALAGVGTVDGTFTGAVWEKLERGLNTEDSLHEMGFTVFEDNSSSDIATRQYPSKEEAADQYSSGGNAAEQQSSDEAVLGRGEAAPEWLQGEVIGLLGCDSWFANEDWSVIGFIDEGSTAASTMTDIAKALEDGGWTSVDIQSDTAVASGQTELSSELAKVDTRFDEGGRNVSGGMNEASTFMKKGGKCKWIMATCIQAGDATSVVLRIQHA